LLQKEENVFDEITDLIYHVGGH